MKSALFCLFENWEDDYQKAIKNEIDRLTTMKKAVDNKNIKFMLSNVIEHKDARNNILEKWILLNNFKIIEYNGKIKSKRKEVLILNY